MAAESTISIGLLAGALISMRSMLFIFGYLFFFSRILHVGLDKQDSNLDDGRRTELDQSCIDVLAPFKKPFAMYNSAPGRDRLDSAQLNKSPVTTFPKLSGWPVMRPHCGRMHHSVVSQ